MADFERAERFVPTGCVRVSCKGVDTTHTRCKPGQAELIAFLWYAKPAITVVYPNPLASPLDPPAPPPVFPSNFHMLGRSIGRGETRYHTKRDVHEKYEDVADPWANLAIAYPYTTNRSNYEVVELCFCCDCEKMATI